MEEEEEEEAEAEAAEVDAEMEVEQVSICNSLRVQQLNETITLKLIESTKAVRCRRV